MANVLESHKVVGVDCDDTLVMWDISKYPDMPRITVDLCGPVQLVVNQKNVNLVRKLAKLGYQIVVWSQTGYDWARVVGKAVGIDDVTSLYMTKPRYHIDDMPASVWIGDRLWRDPVTGNSTFEE